MLWLDRKEIDYYKIVDELLICEIIWNILIYIFCFCGFIMLYCFKIILFYIYYFKVRNGEKLEKIWINFLMIGRNKDKYNKIKKINYYLYEFWKLFYVVNKYIILKVFVLIMFFLVFR